MHLPWWFPFGRVDEIAPRALHDKLTRADLSLQLLDVRTEAEFGESHIVNARNVPIYALPKNFAALNLDPHRPVVAICLSGHRSVPAFRLLKRAGFRQVYSLSGGMLAWWSARLPAVKGQTE